MKNRYRADKYATVLGNGGFKAKFSKRLGKFYMTLLTGPSQNLNSYRKASTPLHPTQIPS